MHSQNLINVLDPNEDYTFDAYTSPYTITFTTREEAERIVQAEQLVIARDEAQLDYNNPRGKW